MTKCLVGEPYLRILVRGLGFRRVPGKELTDDLRDRIRKTIRANASPRHVPAKIIVVPDIPYTLNMKKVELSVKKVIEWQTVLNRDTLKNPESLDYYASLKELIEE